MTRNLSSQADGCCTLRVAPEAIAADVPDNSRRLIEKQMARLPRGLQALLDAASIAGVEFAADVVAAALETNAERVEARCDELARQALFLRRLGIEEWPDGTRTTRYGFRHTAQRQLWSERVPAQRRQRFQLRIGEWRKRSRGRRVVRQLLAVTLIAGCLFALRPALAAPPCCQGDCNGDGVVRIDELVVRVGIALGSEPVSACAHGGDCPCSGPADLCDIGFMVRAVNAALYGCPQ